MTTRIGRLSAGVGRRHPVIARKATFSIESVTRVRARDGFMEYGALGYLNFGGPTLV